MSQRGVADALDAGFGPEGFCHRRGEGLTFDPPVEFSRWSGTFSIGEATPGWHPLLIPFRVGQNSKEISVEICLTGVGTVWVDHLELRSVKGGAKED